MHISTGTILISTAALTDANFAQAVICITEYNQKGATGFVINQPFGRALNELTEFSQSPAFPLYRGGPVDEEHLFFIHRQPQLIQDGIPVADGIYSGGNFKQAVAYLNNNRIGQNDIKIFVGYCGWDQDQLEEEIKEGSWLVTEGDGQTIFSPHTGAALWKQLYEAAAR